jgi:hypothetical protein
VKTLLSKMGALLLLNKGLAHDQQRSKSSISKRPSLVFPALQLLWSSWERVS